MAKPTRSNHSFSMPANYVSIVDLRERWMKQKQQQQEKEGGSGSGSGGGGGHSESQKQQQLHHRRQQQQLQSHQPQEDIASALVEINGVVEVEEENDRCLAVLPREDYDDVGEKADHANSAQNPTHSMHRLTPLPPRFSPWSKPQPQKILWMPVSCPNLPPLLPEKKESGRTKASTTASSVVVSVVPETATALALKADDQRRVDEAPPRALKEEAEQKIEIEGSKYKKNKNRIRKMNRKRSKKWRNKSNQEEEKLDASQEEESEEAVEKLETAAAVSKSVAAVTVAFPTNSGLIPKTTGVPADSTPDKYWAKNYHPEKNKGNDKDVEKETATSAVTKSPVVPIKEVSAGSIGLRKGKYMPEQIRSGVLDQKRTSVSDDSTAEIERRLSKLSTGGVDKTESRNNILMSTVSCAEPVSVRRDRRYGRYDQGRNYTAKQVRETRGVVWVKKGVSPDSSSSYPD